MTVDFGTAVIPAKAGIQSSWQVDICQNHLDLVLVNTGFEFFQTVVLG